MEYKYYILYYLYRKESFDTDEFMLIKVPKNNEKVIIYTGKNSTEFYMTSLIKSEWPSYKLKYGLNYYETDNELINNLFKTYDFYYYNKLTNQQKLMFDMIEKQLQNEI